VLVTSLLGNDIKLPKISEKLKVFVIAMCTIILMMGSLGG